MAVLQQYKCPCCGGAIEFDPTAQKMKCPFCDTEFEIETLNDLVHSSQYVEAEDKMESWNTELNGKWEAGEKLHTYLCESCGGEVLGDDTLGATACPFCGNPIVITDRFEDTKPDLIIPFQLDKKAAKQALEQHLMKKRLLPKAFREENHIDEVKGIYVPFWLYDADVSGAVRYKGTTVRCWSSGKYDYTETKYYSVYREGSVCFERIPVDASSKMEDDMMDSLEPFDFSKCVDFNTAYFAGYLADKYDVSVEENLPRINRRVKQSTEDIFRTTVTYPYNTLQTDDSFIDLRNGSAKYALFPVWLLHTTWNGQKYTFAMNGQSGKFVGNLPMDKKLYWKYWLITFAVSFPIAGALAYLLGMLFR